MRSGRAFHCISKSFSHHLFHFIRCQSTIHLTQKMVENSLLFKVENSSRFSPQMQYSIEIILTPTKTVRNIYVENTKIGACLNFYSVQTPCFQSPSVFVCGVHVHSIQFLMISHSHPVRGCWGVHVVVRHKYRTRSERHLIGAHTCSEVRSRNEFSFHKSMKISNLHYP